VAVFIYQSLRLCVSAANSNRVLFSILGVFAAS
jgi:hypothetical protein